MRKLGNNIRQVIRVDPESFSVKLRFTDGAVGVV
jgi:hypothetical protein